MNPLALAARPTDPATARHCNPLSESVAAAIDQLPFEIVQELVFHVYQPQAPITSLRPLWNLCCASKTLYRLARPLQLACLWYARRLSQAHTQATTADDASQRLAETLAQLDGVHPVIKSQILNEIVSRLSLKDSARLMHCFDILVQQAASLPGATDRISLLAKLLIVIEGAHWYEPRHAAVLDQLLAGLPAKERNACMPPRLQLDGCDTRWRASPENEKRMAAKPYLEAVNWLVVDPEQQAELYFRSLQTGDPESLDVRMLAAARQGSALEHCTGKLMLFSRLCVYLEQLPASDDARVLCHHLLGWSSCIEEDAGGALILWHKLLSTPPSVLPFGRHTQLEAAINLLLFLPAGSQRDAALRLITELCAMPPRQACGLGAMLAAAGTTLGSANIQCEIDAGLVHLMQLLVMAQANPFPLASALVSHMPPMPVEQKMLRLQQIIERRALGSPVDRLSLLTELLEKAKDPQLPILAQFKSELLSMTTALFHFETAQRYLPLHIFPTLMAQLPEHERLVLADDFADSISEYHRLQEVHVQTRTQILVCLPVGQARADYFVKLYALSHKFPLHSDLFQKYLVNALRHLEPADSLALAECMLKPDFLPAAPAVAATLARSFGDFVVAQTDASLLFSALLKQLAKLPAEKLVKPLPALAKCLWLLPKSSQRKYFHRLSRLVAKNRQDPEIQYLFMAALASNAWRLGSLRLRQEVVMNVVGVASIGTPRSKAELLILLAQKAHSFPLLHERRALALQVAAAGMAMEGKYRDQLFVSLTRNLLQLAEQQEQDQLWSVINATLYGSRTEEGSEDTESYSSTESEATDEEYAD